MKTIKIGFFEDKFKKDDATGRDDATNFKEYCQKIAGQEFLIDCFMECFDPTSPRHTVYQIIFNHWNNYVDDASRETVRKQCVRCRHLYWVSTSPAPVKNIYNKIKYEERGLHFALPVDAYKSLNWHDAFQKYRVEIKEWENNGVQGILPPFPIEVLCQQSDSLGDFIMPLMCMDILIQGYLIVHSDKPEWSTLRGIDGVMPSDDDKKKAKEKTSPDALFAPPSASNSKFWFSSVPLEAVKVLPIPFSEEADSLLNQTGIGAKNHQTQTEFRNYAYFQESEVHAQEISTAIERDSEFSQVPGGALRLCWELLKGQGQTYDFTVTNENMTSAKACLLFAKAHEEFTFIQNNLGE